MSRYLEPGEKLPDPPADLPVMEVRPFTLAESAPLFQNLPAPITDQHPRNMEAYDQGRGCILYRTTIPAGPQAQLGANIHDFGWVFVDGQPVGILDRRRASAKVTLPAREKPATLDILVEAMGRVNFGSGVHDRKGLQGSLTLEEVNGPPVATGDWSIFRLGLDPGELDRLKWQAGPSAPPAFWRGFFDVDRTDDTFLDLSTWGKGVVWVNGHCLGRFWNIGPTQTMYLPGPWLKKGRNEVVILDLVGPSKPVLAGLTKPILNVLRPELDFHKPSQLALGRLLLDGKKPVVSGHFENSDKSQTVMFDHPVEGRQFCFDMLSSQDGSPFAAIAELDLLDAKGASIPHASWSVVYADSEELAAEDGSAANAINGQVSDFWHSAWSMKKPPYPHRIVLDLGGPMSVAGFRYTPRQGMKAAGRVKDYQIFVDDKLVDPR